MTFVTQFDSLIFTDIPVLATKAVAFSLWAMAHWWHLRWATELL